MTTRVATKQGIYEVEFKALPADNRPGRFEALVSVFGNVDAIGDRVLKGAFTETLEEWRKSGAPIPIIWSHNWGDPFSHIGAADPNLAEETSKGLKIIGDVDMDNPVAAQVHKLMMGRRVTQFSFGYEVREERPAKDGANELVKLGLIEVGPTLRGMNPSTELLDVKSQLEEAAPESVKTPPWRLEGWREDGTKAAAGENVDQWIIVSDGTGEVVGTHGTKAAAERQMAALQANVEEDADDSADTKAGRRISRATETELRSAIGDGERVLDRLRALLETAGETDEDDDKAAETGNPKGDAGNADLTEEHTDLVARIAESETRFS